MCGKKISYWYKNFLSDFSAEQKKKEAFPEYDFDTLDKSLTEYVVVKEKVLDIEKSLINNRGKKKSEYKTFYKMIYNKVLSHKKIRVPILILENFGPRMCIDDKNLGHYGWTIISNLDTGRIAVMIETRKAKIINEVLEKHVPQKTLNKVKILTKDLAYNYENVLKNTFLNAVGVADKFHVIKLGIQAISDLRVKYRQEELTKERLRREAHVCSEAANRALTEENGEQYKTKKCPPQEKTKNGETILQILSASNRALSQLESKWSKKMKERIQILFELFPDIKKTYELISQFREIYTVKKFGNSIKETASKELEYWFKSVGALDISELQNFASTVKHHQNNVFAYFSTGCTNAYAESLNAKLQRFLRENFGIKNLDFFLWRIKKIFA